MFNLYATELSCTDGTKQKRPILGKNFVDAMKQITVSLPAEVERITIEIMEKDCQDMSSEKLQRCYDWKG